MRYLQTSVLRAERIVSQHSACPSCPVMRGIFIGSTENKNHLGNRSTAGRCDRPDTCIGCRLVLLIAIRAALDQVLSSSGRL